MGKIRNKSTRLLLGPYTAPQPPTAGQMCLLSLPEGARGTSLVLRDPSMVLSVQGLLEHLYHLTWPCPPKPASPLCFSPGECRGGGGGEAGDPEAQLTTPEVGSRGQSAEDSDRHRS